MLVNTEREEFQSGGAQSIDSFEYRLADNAKLFEILSKSIYSNKERAIIRELSTNAWEANVDAGSDRPFEVTLPTRLDPFIKFRDFGKGMTHEVVYSVFSVHGASTKSSSSKDVGGFGIGAKSPFSYTDIFHIKIFQNGVCRVYENAIQQSGKPRMDFKLEMDTDEPDGVEVSLPVKSEDIYTFINEAAIALSSFKEEARPKIINGDHISFSNIVETNIIDGAVPELKIVEGHQELVDGDHNLLVRMGCVTYPVRDNKKVMERMEESIFFSTFATGGAQYVLDLPIDAVKVRPTREDLDYDKDTVNALIGYIDKIDSVIHKSIIGKVRQIRKIDSWSGVAKKFHEVFEGFPENVINVLRAGEDWRNGYNVKRSLRKFNIEAPIKLPFRMGDKTMWVSCKDVRQEVSELYRETFMKQQTVDENNQHSLINPEVDKPLKYVESTKSSEFASGMWDFPDFTADNFESFTVYEYKTGCIKRMQHAFYEMDTIKHRVYFLKKMSPDETAKAKTMLKNIFGEMIQFKKIPDEVMNLSFTEDKDMSFEPQIIRSGDLPWERMKNNKTDRWFDDLDEMFSDPRTVKTSEDKVVYAEFRWAKGDHNISVNSELLNSLFGEEVYALPKKAFTQAQKDKRFIYIEDHVKSEIRKVKEFVMTLKPEDMLYSKLAVELLPMYTHSDYRRKFDSMFNRVNSLGNSVVSRLLPNVDIERKEINWKPYMEAVNYCVQNVSFNRSMGLENQSEFSQFVNREVQNIKKIVKQLTKEGLALMKKVDGRIKNLKQTRPLLGMILNGISNEIEYHESPDTVYKELERYIFKRSV